MAFKDPQRNKEYNRMYYEKPSSKRRKEKAKKRRNAQKADQERNKKLNIR